MFIIRFNVACEISVYFLDEENFYPGAAEYFMFWTSLMTVELITEVQEVETSFLHQRELYKAQILVEEEQQGKEMVLKVKILTENYCFSFVLMFEKVKWALSIQNLMQNVSIHYLQTRLVMDGGKQPFKQEDAVMIYKEVNDVKSVYFAEILDLTGLWKHNIFVQ